MKTSMIKRILSLALCAVLLLGMVPGYAAAQTVGEDSTAGCTHEDGTLWAYNNEDGLTHTFVWSCCGDTFSADHTPDALVQTVLPNCDNIGYTEYYCGTCDGYYVGDIVEPLGHVPGTETGTIPPTCTESGYDYYVCDVCGLGIPTSYVDALGHTKMEEEGVVIDPTCNFEGYTMYACAVCYENFYEDLTPATGHDFDENGICANCGRNSANVITITMTDTFGDGWSGNGITIIEDNNYLCEATVVDGSEDVFSIVMDPALRYEFWWFEGAYPEECAFTISIMGEEVYSATVDDCASFVHGQVLYPICEHNYEISGVTEPTCNDYGYTTYTCTLCGHSYDSNYEMLDHIPGGEGVVVAPTCVDNGYTYCSCAACGETLYYDLLPIAGHTLGADGFCTVCGEPFSVPLRVAEVDVTYENHQDILGDGTACYDPYTNTLTLKDFTYEGVLSGVYTLIPLNIVLEGDNSITVYSEVNSGLYIDSVGGDFNISGTGTLTVYSAGSAIYADNYGDTDLTIGGSVQLILGTVENPIGADAIFVNGETASSVTITDNAWVSMATSAGNAIYVPTEASSLTVSGNAQVYTCGDNCGLDAKNITISGGVVAIVTGNNAIGVCADTLTVTDGTVTVVCGDESISIYAEDMTVTGGTVYAENPFAGVFAGKLSVSGGNLTASGSTYGIYTWAGCTITGGTVEVLSGGLQADLVDEFGNTIDGDAVILGEYMQIVEPEGAFVSNTLTDGYYSYTGIADAQGNELGAFVISCVHNWTAGVCGNCGTPFTVTATGFSLSFEDKILVNCYYTVSDNDAAVEHGMLVFAEKPENPSYGDADWAYPSVYIPESGLYMGQTPGIAAKEMGVERYYVAYVKLSDGSYVYSDVHGYSPATYAYNKLANDNTDPRLKALCVSMLNYGAAAQNFFGYRTDDLMNAGLTDEQKALVVSYDAGLFTGAVAADPAKTGGFVKTATGFSKKNASVSFEGAFAINYYFTPEFAVDGDVTLYVWDWGTYEAAEVLTADNAAATVMTEQNGTWFASVSGIAAKELDDTYYVAAVYTDVDGNTYCTGVIAYSLSRYCINNAKPGMSMESLASATAMYGYYADLYFPN